MRDAALEIALRGDDFALSLVDRARHAVDRLVATWRCRRLARRHLKQLRRLDARLLTDLGLEPADLAALDPTASPVEATRRLAAAAARRRRDVTAEERWLRG